MTCAARERCAEETAGRGRGGTGARGRRGWKTDKDKVRAKVGSWARKWWVVVVRVVARRRRMRRPEEEGAEDSKGGRS